MNSPMLLPLLGLLYILVLGGLSWLRREGLSIRFAVESLLVTAGAVALTWWGGVPLHPVVFLIILYLVTMRVRLLLDIGNSLARRGNFSAADQIYRLATLLGPDPVDRTAIRLNQGVALLQQGALDEAILLFQSILDAFAATGHGVSFSLKHEAACYYNLGVAYQRKGLLPKAIEAFQRVLEVWPVSEYARRAERIMAANRADRDA